MSRDIALSLLTYYNGYPRNGGKLWRNDFFHSNTSYQNEILVLWMNQGIDWLIEDVEIEF